MRKEIGGEGLDRGLSDRNAPLPPPLGRGYVDVAEPMNGRLVVAGWLFSPGRVIDRFRLRFDGQSTAEGAPIVREDVRAAFAAFPEASVSGFDFHVDLPAESDRSYRLLEVLGLDGGEVVGRIRFRFAPDFNAGLPEPHVALRKRVVNNESARSYWLGGFQTFQSMLDAARRWRVGETRRLLDWGCGCGRVTSFLLRDLHDTEVHGCDIDGEAVGWCRDNLGPNFEVIGPFPPTRYPEESFDVIFGYSVMTHLRRSQQGAWLAEMRRILAPGGIFVVSVHGEFATLFAGSPVVSDEIARDGISDSLPDACLDGIAPEGYYRGTFQSRSYTERAFSQGFEVLEYLAQGITNFQDLVVLRRS